MTLILNPITMSAQQIWFILKEVKVVAQQFLPSHTKEGPPESPTHVDLVVGSTQSHIFQGMATKVFLTCFHIKISS